MVRPVQARRDHRAVSRLAAAREGAGGDDAGELDLVGNRPVGVQVPEEPVVIVADRAERGDHQPPAAADLHRPAQVLGVLPADAGIFLVNADCVGQQDRLALVIVDHRVQVADLTQAVAAEHQRVGQRADSRLAGVEYGLDPVHRRRVPVRHPHLRQRGPVHDRAFPAAVGVPHPVQDQALTRGVPDDQVPALPADLVPVEGEARPLRLGDLDRLHIRPQAADHGEVGGIRGEFGRVVAGPGRQRHHLVVVHGQHRGAVQVHRDHEVLSRAGERIVGRRVPHPGQRLGHPGPEGCVTLIGVTRRPGLHLNMSEVSDPAAAHRLLPAGIGLHRLHRSLEVPPARLGPHAGHRLPGTDCAARQRHHGLAHQPHGPVVQHGLALPVRRPAGQLVVGQLSPGRLAQHRRDEHRAVRELRMRAHGSRRPTDLILRQRRQRMRQPPPVLVSPIHGRASLIDVRINPRSIFAPLESAAGLSPALANTVAAGAWCKTRLSSRRGSVGCRGLVGY